MSNKHGDWRGPSRGEHFRRCDYCGSMHPDDFLAAMKEGARPEMADWKYGWPHKFYISVHNRAPDATFCVGSAHGSTEPPTVGENWVAARDMTPEQWSTVKRDGMGRDVDETEASDVYYQFGTRDAHFGKFYTEHLLDADAETLAAINECLPVIFTVVAPGEAAGGLARNETGKPMLAYRVRR